MRRQNTSTPPKPQRPPKSAAEIIHEAIELEAVLEKGADVKSLFQPLYGRNMEMLGAAVVALGGLNGLKTIMSPDGRHVGVTFDYEDEDGVSGHARYDLSDPDGVAAGMSAPFKPALQPSCPQLWMLFRQTERGMAAALAGNDARIDAVSRKRGGKARGVSDRLASFISIGVYKSMEDGAVSPARRGHLKVAKSFSPSERATQFSMCNPSVDTDTQRDVSRKLPPVAALRPRLVKDMTRAGHGAKAVAKVAGVPLAVDKFHPGATGNLKTEFGIAGRAGDGYEAGAELRYLSTPICNAMPVSVHAQRPFLGVTVPVFVRRGLAHAETVAKIIGPALDGWKRKSRITRGDMQLIADFLSASAKELTAAGLKLPGKGATLGTILDSARQLAAYNGEVARRSPFDLPEGFPPGDGERLPKSRAVLKRIRDNVELHQAHAKFQNCCLTYKADMKRGECALYLVSYRRTGDEVEDVAMIEIRRNYRGLLWLRQCYAPFNKPASQSVTRAVERLLNEINNDLIKKLPRT